MGLVRPKLRHTAMNPNARLEAQPATRPNVILLAGPTASGKSRLAQTLAEQVDGIIINADSAQTYRDLPTITDRPSDEAMRRVPHRLFGFLTPRERASAGQYRSWAEVELQQAQKEHRVPVITGGTGLWLQAVTEGFSQAPAHDPKIGQELDQAWALDQGPELYKRLQAVDPATAERLHAADQARILRALAVYLTTGKPISELNAAPRQGPIPGFAFHRVLVLPPKEATVQAIRQRLNRIDTNRIKMEIEKLLDDGITDDDPISRAIGWRNWRDWTIGKCGLEETKNTVYVATHHYAKRQRTWFKKYWWPSVLLIPDIVTEPPQHDAVQAIKTLLTSETPQIRRNTGKPTEAPKRTPGNDKN